MQVDVVLRGYGGYNTRWALFLLHHLFPLELATRPAAVTIFFGANDAACLEGTGKRQHVPLEEYKENLRKMVRHIKLMSPKTVFVLTTPPPIDLKGRREYARQCPFSCASIIRRLLFRTVLRQRFCGSQANHFSQRKAKKNWNCDVNFNFGDVLVFKLHMWGLNDFEQGVVADLFELLVMDPNTRLRYVAWVEFVIKRTALTMTLLYLLYIWYNETVESERRSRKRRYSVIANQTDQLKHLRRFTQVSDQNCIDNLRMDKNAFCRLCYLLEHFGGLTHERFVTIPCKIAMFLNILAHHHKNRTVKGDFYCSGFTVSRYFRQTLKALLRISKVLLIEPVGVPLTCTTEPWKHFKGCLGALDGTYVDVIVRQNDQPKYRTRKGSVAVNVLGVCNTQMNFIYVLARWEGSAADSRVLRDALHRPNGLKVPAGLYHLADCGYTNADGFLTPYRGTRYHLKEWGAGTSAPQTPKELFNLRHSKARNVIERAFCLLKGRWAILRSKS